MTELVGASGSAAASGEATLVVGPAEATIRIAVGDPALAEAITAAIREASPAPPVAVERPCVRLRSRKRAATLTGQLVDAIAIVPVTARNARHLVGLIDQLRASRVAGIQLVWDGATPPRPQIEHHVFAALERARAAPTAAPVVLCDREALAPVLRYLVSA